MADRYTDNKAVCPVQGDFYVSPCGSDEADGSLEHPFQTLNRAVQAIRDTKKGQGATVCLMAGEYRTDGIRLTAEDSGSAEHPVVYRGYGDGEAILNGGVTFRPEDFEPVPEAIGERLQGEAREKVVRIDLKKYGLTKADWGNVHPVGSYCTAEKYDDYVPGLNCELFVNGSRMTVARYPNGEFARLAAVADVGDVWEFPEQNYHYDWPERRNHAGGAYIMDKQTTARVKGWKSLENVWTFGYFYHDWADASMPVRAFDLEHRTFYPAYVAHFGAKKGALYFFYNVLDELDEPGEWYLDREEGWLYLYPPVDIADACVEMTILERSIIEAENVEHVAFENLTLKGTRADAISLKGSDCTFRNLTICGVLGNGIVAEGWRNRVEGCDISHTGRGGIILRGGDREKLIPGCNVADNNLIHDWAEVYLTYNGGVRLEGVGNVCSHNELYNSPHSAIFYYGNDHLVEYNYIHEMVLQSSDAGAIYSGQDWASQGCVIRYNRLENIGAGEFRPDGIYFDDGLSGQSAYGNLLINVNKFGFLIGGGRDVNVYNNIIINAGMPIFYDQRCRDGFVSNGWAMQSVNNYEKSSMWVRLRQAPFRSQAWAEKYPTLARLSCDFSKPDDPDFGPNPSYSHVHDNLIIDAERRSGKFDGEVPVYSCIERNCAYATMEEAGLTDGYLLTDGAQALKDMPEFKNLPVSEMGLRRG